MEFSKAKRIFCKYFSAPINLKIPHRVMPKKFHMSKEQYFVSCTLLLLLQLKTGLKSSCGTILNQIFFEAERSLGTKQEQKDISTTKI